MGAYVSNIIRVLPYCWGNREKRSFEPSSGGIGIRLNTASVRLMMTMYEAISINGVITPCCTNLIIHPKMRAMTRFESGPAAAIRNSPERLFLRLYGLYGTGLAQPKTNPGVMMAIISGRMTEPKGSICLIGFKVSLPCNRAVGSPKRSAI